MSAFTTRLTAAVAGGAALMLAAPITATAAPVAAQAAPVTPGAAQTMETNHGAYHQYHHFTTQTAREDPQKGTVEYAVAVQKREDSDGRIYYRATAQLTKISKAARVEIGRVAVDSLLFEPEFSGTNSIPVNSGAAVSISSSSPWVDATESHATGSYRSISATVRFSVRWSDGTLSRIDSGATNEYPSPYSYLNQEKKTNTVVGKGSSVADHYGDAAKGSVRVDVGLRLYASTTGEKFGYSAVQPYASISKLNTRAARVQIDGIEARQIVVIGGSRVGELPGWPFNVTARSSGAGNSASLSTAITSIVVPNMQDANTRTLVRVYYSVRWADGTLSTNVYDGPLTASSLKYPVTQGL